MADFCGLTRVKTWRWSRLFACAVAVLCAISPISAFPDTCPSVSVTCNPGFYNSGGACTKCASGKYNAKSGATSCINCPANTISNGCPEYTVGDFNYGRPGIICKAGYYRAYDVDTNNGTIKGLKCTQCPTGLNKQADSGIGLVDFSAGEPVPVSNGVVQITNISSGADQCDLCATNYYQKGYYTTAAGQDNPYNTAESRCAPCSSVSSGGSSLQACNTNGTILCGANYYREKQSDGTVKCKPCGSAYNKPADTNTSDKSTGIEQCYWHCSSNAYVTARTDNDGALVGECALFSTISSNSNAYMVEGGQTYDKIVCKHGYYPRVNIFVDKSNADYGKVWCVDCPTGLTTNDYDQYGEPEGTTVGNSGYWANEADPWNAYCENCAEGWFLVPNPTRCYSDQYPLSRKVCLKCPTTNTSNVVACGGLNYAGQDNISADAFSGIYGKDKGYLLCKKGYYADWQKTYTDGSSYCNTSGGTPQTSEAYCSQCNNGASSATDQSYPSQWWNNFWDSKEVSSYPDITQGSDQCNSCKSGYFVPSGSASETNCYKCPSNTVNNDNKCSTGKVNCKANYYLVDNGGDPSVGASYYDNRFSCNACPTFTGKLKDSNHSVKTVGEQQCNICTNGYYGSSVREESSFSVNNCKRCPQFTVLGSLGICIRGHTDEPTNTTDDIINGDATACYIPEGTSSGSTGDGIQATPLFRDTMGVFLISRDSNVNKQCQIPNTSPYARSGTCTLKSGTKCVYVDTVPTGKRAACIDAVVNAVKSIYPCSNNSCTDEEKKNLITKTTAADVVAHAGMENPWFCCDPSKENAECDTKIAGFKNALMSGSCVVNSSDIKDCEVGTDANCAKGDGT